jgi:23S rRNA (pseudouridine1915-N3)-methyltransferase
VIHVLAVGHLRDGPEAALYARYAERIRPRLALAEVAEGHGAPAERRRREAAALLGLLPADAFVVALDLGGEQPDSDALARLLERWLGQSRALCFLIGGAEGLDSSVLARAGYVLSLGRLTWPHMLARAMLAEQVYRARAIAAGHPYHRGGRP